MSESTFKFSLTALFWLVIALVIAGLTLPAAGIYWTNTDLPALVVFTLLAGLIVLILGGGALIYIWGKRYMAKG